MEKSNQSSFLKSLALAFGDGLAFGVAVKLAQGPSKTRENGMTDLGPLAERLRKVEDHKEQSQTIDKEALMKFGEGLDGRVFEKVVVALEARLTEHAGQVDRRLAEIDAQVALDLKAVDTHTAAQTSAVERALQQIEAQVRDYVAASQQSSAEQIAGVDQKLSALQEALPAKFREIIEAVRQSMEARLALELTEVENRVSAGSVAPEHLQELEGKLRSEMDALSGRLSTEMHRLAEQQHSQAAPLQQALQQLETKLTTLREELPPKIRQIVEAVEASMDARISAGDRQTGDRLAGLEQTLAALRAEMPGAGSYRQEIDDNLRRHAEQVGALDQKLTILQEELPPKIKAIVDAVRDSLDARMAVELKAIEDRHAQFRQQLAAESQTPSLQQDLAKLHADLAALDARLETGDRHVAEHFGTELEALHTRHRIEVEQLENRLRSERTAENIPAQIQAAVDQMGHTMETRLAGEIRDLAARQPDRSPDLEKALQYTSLLEARVQALEQKLQRSAEETVERAVDHVWQALESRLQQRAPQPPPPVVQPQETITGLRQKSTTAEQSVMDLIAGIGQLFEKPAPRPVREAPPAPPEAPPPAEPQAVEKPAPPAPVLVMPEPPAPEPPAAVEPSPPPDAHEEPVEPVAVPVSAAFVPEEEDKPPVILFKPKEAGRKWRIPFVSSFLLLAMALAWLEFM